MKWFDIADELLPPVYRAIKDMYAYAKSLDGEFKNWLSYMERILNNFFVQKCDLQTIEYWEEKLGITMFQSESIEQRRQNILEHLNNTNPTSEPYVRSIIERMFPNTEYDLYFDVEHDNPYDLNIDIYTTDDEALEEFKEWLRRMCPAHIYTLVYKAIETEFERPLTINCGLMSVMCADLGDVEAQSSYKAIRVLSPTVDLSVVYNTEDDTFSVDGEQTWLSRQEFKTWCDEHDDALPVTGYKTSLYQGQSKINIPESNWDWEVTPFDTIAYSTMNKETTINIDPDGQTTLYDPDNANGPIPYDDSKLYSVTKRKANGMWTATGFGTIGRSSTGNLLWVNTNGSLTALNMVKYTSEDKPDAPEGDSAFFNSTKSDILVETQNVLNLYSDSGETIEYDDTKEYSVTNRCTLERWYETDLGELVDNNNALAWKNTSENSIRISQIKYSAEERSLLPEVRNLTGTASNGFVYTQDGYAKTISASSITQMYADFSSTSVTFNSNVVYGVQRCNYGGENVTNSNEKGFVVVNINSCIGVKTEEISATLFSIKIMECVSTDVELVKVYSSSDGKRFDAFKYDSYYYVLDNEHNSWTNDLSSIGYVLALNYFKASNVSTPSNILWYSNDSRLIYSPNTLTQIPYDSTKKYTITDSAWTDSNNTPQWGQTIDGFSVANIGSYINIRYTGSRTPNRSFFKVSIEDKQSTTIEAYFTNEGSSATSNADVGRNSNYYLYDAQGNNIPYNSSKTYVIEGVYKYDGTRLDTSSSDFIQDSAGSMMWYSNVLPSTGSWYYAYKMIIKAYE